MKLLLLITLISFTILGCTKEIDVASYSNCHHSQGLDSTAISNKLLGEWNWESTYCFSKKGRQRPDKDLRIVFYGNASYTVTVNNIPTNGTWGIRRLDGTSWELVAVPAIEQVYGRILLCGSEVLFNNSYIDGCDNVFYR